MTPEKTSGRIFRLLSYLFFALALMAFLGVLIPALFLGEPTAALLGAVVAIAGMLLALLAGWFGFDSGRKEVPETHQQTSESKAHWRPEEMPMDEENWLRIHGGPGHKDKPPGDDKHE